MVLLRVRMLGDGTKANPYMPPLPTFAMRAVDYATGLCVVDIPASLLPPGAAQIGVTRQTVNGIPNVVTGVQAQDRQKVADYLDKNYPKLAGYWRPSIE